MTTNTYVLSPKWVEMAPVKTDDDGIDKTNIWVVSAMFEDSEYNNFQDLSK